MRPLRIHDRVEFWHDKPPASRGSRGVVVDLLPQAELYLVRLLGKRAGVVAAYREDLRPLRAPAA